MKTPIFILNLERVKDNYKEFENLTKKHIPNYKICYSVKTNPNKEILKELKKLKCNFEVASLDEIKLVKSDFVVFNSACKTKEELEIAIKNKFLINIDSKSEIDKIANIISKTLEAGLRVSLEESKFGVSPDKLKEIIEYAKSKNINIICLHFHQGTQLSFNQYEKGLSKCSEIIKKSNIKLKYIDVGGGFPDRFQLKNLGLDLNYYFAIVKKYFADFNSCIILEPGRCLVSDSLTLFTKVIAIKENFNKKYAILDAGINLLPKITLASYKFDKLKKEKSEKKQNYILAGPLLFSNDTLGIYSGNLQEGDILKVENAGAYCYSLAWELSYKKPKILLSE